MIFSEETMLLVRGLATAFETPEPDSDDPKEWPREITRIKNHQDEVLRATLRFFRHLESESEEMKR